MSWRVANSSVKLSKMLIEIDQTHALAVARCQLYPMATLGTMAAAKVPQPNVPSSAMRSSQGRKTRPSRGDVA